MHIFTYNDKIDPTESNQIEFTNMSKHMLGKMEARSQAYHSFSGFDRPLRSDPYKSVVADRLEYRSSERQLP